MLNVSLARSAVSYLRGIGQIMLQESAWTGALFLAGIAVNSLLMFGGAFIGALCGLATAKLFKLGSDEELYRGYFGFNGALVGICVLFFFPLTIPAIAFIVAGSALSSLIMRLLSSWGKLSPYTAPFIVSAWIMLVIAHMMGLSQNALGVGDPLGEFAAVARGVGQVMFQDNWLTGALFLAGLAVCSREAATWAAIGASIGLVCARGLGYPADLTLAGIFGFNAALAGVALPSKFPRNAAIPPLTAPFVLATWLVIVASWFTQQRAEGA